MAEEPLSKELASALKNGAEQNKKQMAELISSIKTNNEYDFMAYESLKDTAKYQNADRKERKRMVEIEKDIALTLKKSDSRAVQTEKNDSKIEREKKLRDEKSQQALDKLTGLGKVAHAMALAAAKAKETLKGKVKDFAVDKVKSIAKAAGNLMSMLLKALALTALWAALKFIASKDWAGILDDVRFWCDTIFTAFTRWGAWRGLKDLGTFFKENKRWNSIINHIKSMFGFGPKGKLTRFFNAMTKATKTVKAFPGSVMSSIINSTKSFLGDKFPKLVKWYKQFKTAIKGIASWPGSYIASIITRIKGVFSGKGSGLVSKAITGVKSMWATTTGFLSGIFTKITGWIKSIFTVGDDAPLGKVIEKVRPFIKGAFKILGKLFFPLTILMALWDAVQGAMTGFEETEGGMFDKIMGGISGAIKALLDFFIFDLANMVQDVIVWIGEFFGFDMSAVVEFDLVGKIKTAVFKVIDFVVNLFKFEDDSMQGIFMSLFDILYLPLNMAVNFLKSIFKFGDPEKPFKLSEFLLGIITDTIAWIQSMFDFSKGDTKDGWSIMTYLSTVVTDIVAYFKGLFALDSKGEATSIPGMILQSLSGIGDTLLGFFKQLFIDIKSALNPFSSDDASKEEIEAEIKSLEGDVATDSWHETEGEKQGDMQQLKALKAKLAKMATGGKILPGGMAVVGEGSSGGEIVLNTSAAAARVIPAKETAAIMGGGGGMVNAPTTNTVVTTNNATSSMAVAASSIDPNHAKYFRI